MTQHCHSEGVTNYDRIRISGITAPASALATDLLFALGSLVDGVGAMLGVTAIQSGDRFVIAPIGAPQSWVGEIRN